MNILFEYLYRDAGNNKLWNSVVFSNLQNMSAEECNIKIRSILIDQMFFVAEKSTLPELSFDKQYKELDHGWYEFFSAEYTSKKVNDKFNRDIIDFIGLLSKISMKERSYFNLDTKPPQMA